MSIAILERLQAERQQLADYVAHTLEGVEGRDLSDAELRTVTDTKARIEAIDNQVKPLAAYLETRSAAADLTGVLSRAERRPSVETRTMGQIFTESDVFKTYPGRGTSSRLMVETRAVSLPSVLADFASVLTPAPQRDITPPVAPTTLLDLIPSIPVTTNSVDLVVYSNSGGTTAAVVAEGNAKPAVEFAVSVTTKTLDTVAAYTQMSRQLIEDAPAVRARIDTMLAREIRIKSESEAAAALVAAVLPTATDTTSLLNAIRKGVATVQTAGYNPTGVLLNPADYAALDIAVFSGTLNGPTIGQRFWGLTPIPHAAQAEGTATVGDFSAGVERYARTGVNLYITDSHDTTFTANILTILAEAREKTVVVRPAALVECAKSA